MRLQDKETVNKKNLKASKTNFEKEIYVDAKSNFNQVVEAYQNKKISRT